MKGWGELPPSWEKSFRKLTGNACVTRIVSSFLTYILNAFPVDSLASLSSLLADHNTLQQRVNHRHSKGVIKGHNLHLQ